ncbi:MAG TPA: radical SAM protein, partial [Polyangia bacterium]|nr:radical SAM protein [Polyangia bacterium]
MTAPARSLPLSLAVAEAAPRCQDELVVGAETNYALMSQVQGLAFDRTVPLNVSLELTLNCNIRCLHCYNLDRDLPQGACHDRSGAPDTRPDLSLDEIMRVLEELRDAGCLFLTLSGGEVLTYPHLYAVLDRARELNFAVQLLTNGTMLQPGVAGRLASYRNLLGVSVSLYGATADVHDGITQMPGSWKRTWDGAERLRAAGIAVRLKFIVMRPNAHQVEEMRAQAEARRFAYLVDVTITPRHDGTRGSLETRVREDQLAALYRGPLRDLLPTGKLPVTEERFPCNCARGNCAINVKGDVHPCVSVPWAAGNVREQRFADIWQTSPVFQRIRGLRIADYEACAPCPDKPYCSRNRGASFNYSGSYTGTDPFVCRSAALTREAVTAGAPDAP